MKKGNSKIEHIQKFINKNFKKNHILSKNRKVFDWLYYNNYELTALGRAVGLIFL